MNRYQRSIGVLVFVALIFIIVNSLSYRVFPDLLLDLTSDKAFTLTEGTQKILGELDTPINMFYYNSIDRLDAPAETRRYAQVVKETLEAYQRFAPDKVILHVIDPRLSMRGAAQAKEFGLHSLPIAAHGNAVYFGLAGVSARGDIEVIPSFQDLNAAPLEYTLSLLVQQLAKPHRPKLGLMSGLPMAGGFDAKSGKELKPWLILDELNKRYEVENVSTDSDQIPSTVKVLMVVHPKKLSTTTLFAIDQFVMAGGRLLAFVDPFSEQDTGETYFGIGSIDRASNIDILFKAWGIELLPKKVVGDSLYAMEASRDPRVQSVRLPSALGLPRQALSHSDVSIAGLGAINMTTAGVLKLRAGANTRLTPLIQSSSSSTLFDTKRFSRLVAPEDMIKEITPEVGVQHVMAARIEGEVTSAFPDGFEGHPGISVGALDINAVVVADTDLLTDRMWAQVRDVQGNQQIVPWADNERFVSNVLDDLFGADELIESRNRGAVRHVFERVENLQRQIPVLRVREAFLKQELAAIEKATAEPQSPTNQPAMNQAEVRQELLEVQGALLNNVHALGIKLKILNIVLIPMASLVIIFTCKWVVARLVLGYRRNLKSKTKKN